MIEQLPKVGLTRHIRVLALRVALRAKLLPAFFDWGLSVPPT